MRRARRDSGRRDEDRITSPTKPLTRHAEVRKITQVQKVPVTIFSPCRNCCLFNSPFFSHFVSGTLTILKIFKLLWFLADRLKSILFFFSFSSQKSLNKNVLGRRCYSHKQSPRIKQLAWLYQITCFTQHTSVGPCIPSRFGVVVWAVRILGSCWYCASLCVCALTDHRKWRHKSGSGQRLLPMFHSAGRTFFQSCLCASYGGSNLGQGLQGVSNRLILH